MIYGLYVSMLVQRPRNSHPPHVLIVVHYDSGFHGGKFVIHEYFLVNFSSRLFTVHDFQLIISLRMQRSWLRFISSKGGLDSFLPGWTNMATHQDTGYELTSVEEGQQIITPYDISY